MGDKKTLNETPINGRFVPSYIYDLFVLRCKPSYLFLIVFLLAFVIQAIIALIEGNFFSNSNIEKPLIENYTILAGGTFLIPFIFVQAAIFYSNVENVFSNLIKNGAISPHYKENVFSTKKSAVLINVIIFVFVICIDFFQFRTGANVGINYVHVIKGNLTICGWYYSIIFPFLSYCLIIFILDSLIFMWFIKTICVKKIIKPILLFPDYKAGLSELFGLGQKIVFIQSIFGIYFLVIFINWMSYNPDSSFLLNLKRLLPSFGFFILFPTIILINYFLPIVKLIKRVKNRAMLDTFRKFEINSIDPSAINYRERIIELNNNGFFIIYEMINKLNLSCLEVKLLARLYSFLILPFFYPLAIGIFIEIAKRKLLA